MAIADVLLTNVYYHACVAESKCQYLQEFHECAWKDSNLRLAV